MSKPVKGVVFPPGDKGDRSSMEANSRTVMDAVSGVTGVDVGGVSLVQQLREMAAKWRFTYEKGFVSMFELAMRSPENAVKIAEQGLASARRRFEFVDDRDGGRTTSLEDAMGGVDLKTAIFHTAEVRGEGSFDPTSLEFAVPYKRKTLRGVALQEHLDKWVKNGTIEPSAAHGIRKVMANPAWLDLRGRFFVLLGAGSAMGPIKVLLSLGANVIAVDLDRPKIWERLISMSRKSPGRLIFPTKTPQAEMTSDEELYAGSGCNLITDTPYILKWLLSVVPGESLTIGSYAYLDGALHVQVSLAMDGIVEGLVARRPNISVAYLMTPTDLHMIPEDANQMSLKLLNRARPTLVLDRIFNLASGGKLLQKNARKPVKSFSGQDLFYVNSISTQQGPNYALAKRIQLWRSVVCRENQKCIVSCNVAPASYTASNLHVRSVGWALKGMWYFDCMEVFPQETTNAVMTALMLYDLNDPTSPSHPDVKLHNPMEITQHGAIHGGTFRSAYKFGTMGEVAAIIYFLSYLRPLLMLGLFIAYLSFVLRLEFKK